MFEEICKEIENRSKNWVNSMCATPDEVRICWLITEVERLNNILIKLKQTEYCQCIFRKQLESTYTPKCLICGKLILNGDI